MVFSGILAWYLFPSFQTISNLCFYVPRRRLYIEPADRSSIALFGYEFHVLRLVKSSNLFFLTRYPSPARKRSNKQMTDGLTALKFVDL